MKIEITCRNCTANDHLRDVIEQKLAKLNKYFGDKEALAKVCLKKEASSLTTEVMLDYAGKFVRATASSDNFYDNIDVVLPKIEGQIRKYRTRFDQSSKISAFKESAIFTGGDVEEKDKSVVKEKRFTLKPMTVEEAIEDMELLGHSFYVFLEAKTNTVQVLYLRNDGDLGLIEPQI